MTRPNVSKELDGPRSHGSNVILYLPPGPLFQGLRSNPKQDNGDSTIETALNGPWDKSPTLSKGDSPQHILASTQSATVVTVNYRLGNAEQPALSLPEKDPESESSSSDQQFITKSKPPKETDFFQYPTPIHDTLAGFDWIQQNLQPTRLAIFGSHIGGSLALMLALTEASSIQAVAALNPVCDWPGLDEYCTTEDTDETRQAKQRRKHAPADLVPLLEARARFFTSPERCFDAFASPILFLRSAGREVPRVFPEYVSGPEYPVPVLKRNPKVTSADKYAAPEGSVWDRDVYPDEDSDGVSVDSVGNGVAPVRRRKALSRWPPYGLDYGLSGRTWTGGGYGIRRLQVRLPWVRVLVQEENGGLLDGEGASTGSTVLARQGEEMVSVMRRACFWGREKGVGERRVTLQRVDESSVHEAGRWIGDVFDGTLDDESS